MLHVWVQPACHPATSTAADVQVRMFARVQMILHTIRRHFMLWCVRLELFLMWIQCTAAHLGALECAGAATLRPAGNVWRVTMIEKDPIRDAYCA